MMINIIDLFTGIFAIIGLFNVSRFLFDALFENIIKKDGGDAS